jgi:hypothetical protein
MKQAAAQVDSVEGIRDTALRARRMPVARLALSIVIGVTMVSFLGCGSDSEHSAPQTTVTPDGRIIVISPSTPGPNDPLTPFEQRRLLNRIQRDPQHQLSRLSARERHWLASAAAAERQQNGEED